MRSGLLVALLLSGTTAIGGLEYPLTDIGQTACSKLDSGIECPAEGTEFSGLDGQHSGAPASFAVDADGAVTNDDDPAQRVAFDAETGALSLAD